MDVLERLSLEQAEAHDLLACVHRHRYALAAELCAGLRVADVPCGSGYGSRILSQAGAKVTGVDNDAPTIEAARAALATETGIVFECADVHEFVSRPLSRDFDAVVMFEGIEHLQRPEEALAALERHARQGMRLVASIPNSRTLAEDNPFHVTDFDYDTAMRAFEGFDDVEILYQFNAEGSLIRGSTGGDLEGRLVLAEHGEPDYCNNFIALVNFADRVSSSSAAATMQLELAPTHTRHMIGLERANRELWRVNQRLHRDHLGSADSAAAAQIARRDDARAQTPGRRARAAIGRRIPAPLRPLALGAWRFLRATLGLGGDRSARSRERGG